MIAHDTEILKCSDFNWNIKFAANSHAYCRNVHPNLPLTLKYDDSHSPHSWLRIHTDNRFTQLPANNYNKMTLADSEQTTLFSEKTNNYMYVKITETAEYLRLYLH